MNRRRTQSALTALMLGASLAATAPALADEPPVDAGVYGRDHITLGVAGVYGPSYEGSDDGSFFPVPIVAGRIHGIDVTPRPGGLALNVLGAGDDARTSISFGPVATYSANRSRQIKDPVVRAAGKLKSSISLGLNGGITTRRLLDPYDSLTASVDVVRDVNGASGGTVWTPSLSYMTPLSRAAVVNLSLSARHVDGRYARYYYSVTPQQSAASGLPQFAAKGGWDNAAVSLLAGYDLSGNLADGGLTLVGIARYSRMLHDGKATPYTAIRGSASQWTFGAGLAYTF